MLRIYGTVKSRTARTLWMAEELGVPYELVPVDYRARQTRTPEFLAVNPNGHVPAIDDDGLRLHESMAINLYLARRHPGSPLSPRDLAEEGRCLSWSFWAVTELESPALTVFMQSGALPPERRDPQKLARAIGALRPTLAVLEQALAASGDGGSQGYLLGDRFTVADLNVAAVLAWVRAAPGLLEEYPMAAAWLARCLGREGYLRIKAMREAAA
jgi:glutathione S-transferase